MMMPANGHRAHGFSSAHFLDSDEILKELDLKGDETFMDAGCGDGHNAIKLLEDYNHKGTVYAVDIYDASIEDMEVYKKENEKFVFLLVYQSNGHYSFPKGHMEEGETEIETALREVKEEGYLVEYMDKAVKRSVEITKDDIAMIRLAVRI